MAHARRDDEWIGLRRDAHGRRRVRHWFPGDLRAFATAFVVSVLVVLVASWLLEWAADL